MSKRAIFVMVLLVVMALLFLAGCDDGDGDNPESLMKMMYNFFLISISIFIATSCFDRLSSRKKQDAAVLTNDSL